MTRSTKTLSTVAVAAVVALGTVGVVEADHGGDDPGVHHGRGQVTRHVRPAAAGLVAHPRHGRSLDDLPNHP